MLLIILLVVLFVVAIGGGRWGYSRYAYWSWSPAAIIVVVALVMFYTGHLNWR